MDHQAEQVSSIVIRTRDRELLAAAVAATRLAMSTGPSGTVARAFKSELVDGDVQHSVDLAVDFAKYALYEPRGVGEPTRHLVRSLFEHVMREVPSLPQTEPPRAGQRIVHDVIELEEAAEDTPASALHRGLTLTTTPGPGPEHFSPDWGDDEPPPPPRATMNHRHHSHHRQ